MFELAYVGLNSSRLDWGVQKFPHWKVI